MAGSCCGCWEWQIGAFGSGQRDYSSLIAWDGDGYRLAGRYRSVGCLLVGKPGFGGCLPEGMRKFGECLVEDRKYFDGRRAGCMGALTGCNSFADWVEAKRVDNQVQFCSRWCCCWNRSNSGPAGMLASAADWENMQRIGMLIFVECGHLAGSENRW